MAQCQICKRTRNELRFATDRISICKSCVNSLNKYQQPAQVAYDEAASMLRRGILRRTGGDPDGVEEQVEHALDRWVTKLVKDTSNTTKIFRQMRAHRRNLLRIERPESWNLPADWLARARRIRIADNMQCHDCAATDVELHVHHIVHRSSFGSDRQENLVTLCRACHENLHGREFGGDDLESSPIEMGEPQPLITPAMPPAPAPLATIPRRANTPAPTETPSSAGPATPISSKTGLPRVRQTPKTEAAEAVKEQSKPPPVATSESPSPEGDGCLSQIIWFSIALAFLAWLYN